MSGPFGLKFTPSGLKKERWQGMAVRFLFGGCITAITGLVAHGFGPVVGGLFLAFPAILPASMTLVAKHDGKEQAGEDAYGAVFGALGLFGFGAVTWALGPRLAAWLTLLCAGVVWLLLAVALWAIAERVLGEQRRAYQEAGNR